MEALTTKTIKTQEQYQKVMATIETLLDSKPNSPQFELLEVLSILADEYENNLSFNIIKLLSFFVAIDIYS